MRRRYSHYQKSRLQMIEDKKNRRQAILFTVLTVIVLMSMVVFGVPVLIKLAIFLGDLRSSKVPVEKEKESMAIQSPTLLPSFEATYSPQISIQGYSLPNSKIKLLLNNYTLTTESDLEGNFIFSDISLNKGENKISAVTIRNKQESLPSQTLTITLDPDPPSLIISSPQDKQNFFDLEKEIEIKGTTELDVQVYINNRLVIIDSSGEFLMKYQLSEGENNIVVRVLDPARNETKKTVTVKYFP